MLRFTEKCSPTSNAGKVLTECLESTLDGYKEFSENYGEDYPNTSKIFSLEDARDLVKKLLDAHKDLKETYYLTDYHYLVIYEILECEKDIYNNAYGDTDVERIGNKEYKLGTAQKEERKEFKRKAKSVEYIEECLFWDLDFLLGKEILLGMDEKHKKQLGFSSETFGVIMGMKPHPDEIKLEIDKEISE